MRSAVPQPPKHLGAEGKKLWRKIVSGWQLDESGLIVLALVCESFDRMREAQALLKKDGPVVKDRFDQDKVHPAAHVERDSRAAVLRGLRQLGLDLEPLQPGPGRPPGSPNKR